MKHIYTLLLTAITIVMMGTEVLQAQQEVTVRELNTYAAPLTSQNDLPNHPLVTSPATIVTFDAVVVAYPKNSGLASITNEDVPGRIHLFVTDVNAIADGREGMSIQFVVDGAQRTALEALTRGDVIRVVGDLRFFGNTNQFNASSVEPLGSIEDAEYTALAPLLEPTVIALSELNVPSEQAGLHKWNAANYTTYNARYVKLEGLEVIDSFQSETGRPWFILSDGTTIITSNDTSLRFRNDRSSGGNDYSTLGLGYNARRLAVDLDGPFTPPAPGSVVDVSGFVVVNTFNPGGFDESGDQSTLKIAPWDDGVVWASDGVDPALRLQPEGWPNDFVVQGFASLVSDLEISPETILDGADVTVSANVLLPEEDYTLNSVVINFTATDFGGVETTGEATMSNTTGGTYSHTFTGGFDGFTNVEFTITATATTPGAVETKGRLSGSFDVGSSTQASPVVISAESGEYTNFVQVSMTTPSPDSTIYYTTDGADPDDTSTEYTGAINVLETTTIKAIAYSGTLSPSPITSATYTIVNNDKETLLDLRTSATGQSYRYTGDAVMTYFRPNNRNQRYIQDASGAVLIDDNPGTITTTYNVGDVFSGLIGNLGAFSGTTQFVPQLDPGAPAANVAVEPPTVTLAELDFAIHESMLVRVENVSFSATGDFSSGTNYQITDPSLGEDQTVVFRTSFSESNYIGQPIPTDNVNLTALVTQFSGTIQLVARSLDDFEIVTSNELTEGPKVFSLNQNYPNPFNPSTLIRYNIAEASEVRLAVYDILGRRVATLVNELQTPGAYTVNFNANHLASGTYIYRLEAGNFVSIKKMMLIK
jgi:hypothetical protein